MMSKMVVSLKPVTPNYLNIADVHHNSKVRQHPTDAVNKSICPFGAGDADKHTCILSVDNDGCRAGNGQSALCFERERYRQWTRETQGQVSLTKRSFIRPNWVSDSCHPFTHRGWRPHGGNLQVI